MDTTMSRAPDDVDDQARRAAYGPDHASQGGVLDLVDT